jgi:hypothetical protein
LDEIEAELIEKEEISLLHTDEGLLE